MARLEGAAALPALLDAVRAGQPLGLRFTAAASLGSIPGPEASGALEQLTLPVEDRGLRSYGLSMLAQRDMARAAEVASRSLDDPDPLFALSAVTLLGRIGGAAGRARLQERLVTEKRVRVRAAIEAVLHAR
jgi:HEAT repeat protein